MITPKRAENQNSPFEGFDYLNIIQKSICGFAVKLIKKMVVKSG